MNVRKKSSTEYCVTFNLLKPLKPLPNTQHTDAQDEERFIDRYLSLADTLLDGERQTSDPALPQTDTPRKAA